MTTEEWNTYFNGHWYFNGAKQDKHLAMFPEELPKRLIKMFSFPEETVLDPFMGSGTTASVARKLGRNSVGYEINPEFIPIIKERIGGNDLYNKAEIIELQDTRKIDFAKETASLPYQFVDVHKINKIIDVKKLQFGSKIDKDSQTQREYFTVKEVLAANLVLLNNDLIVRLLGIKPKASVNGEAAQFIEEKTRGHKVTLQFDEIKYDEDNRLLCYLYLDNKTFINAHLLKYKLADVDDSFDFKYKNKFLKYTL